MIYLIGGPPKCGKTTLAKKLSKHLEVQWISADTLQSIAFAYTVKKDVPKKFPWRVARKKAGRGNDLAFSAYSSAQIVRKYRSQAKATWPAIDMVAASEINDRNDYIIEGYQVEPRLADKLTKKYGKKNIRTIFLIRTDKQTLLKDIKKSTTLNDWIKSRTKNEETFGKIAEMISRYGLEIGRETKKYKIPALNMDKNFEGQIREVIKFLKQN
ncbi:MAG: hypothetical protein WC831_01790 [Parcubacteria group bacterium]|jgi:2-phosphoglycerate kinase